MKVFMAMPTYDGQVNLHAARAYYATASRALPLEYGDVGRSLLANAFNVLWATALNLRERSGVTHFAMLHSDVIPDDGWLDVLVREMAEHRAQLVSVVVPIKNELGVTSTAIGHAEEQWEPLRRLTLSEVHRLPGTFSAADCGYPDRPLLVNTGCWLADITDRRFDRLWFEVRDTVVHEQVTDLMGRQSSRPVFRPLTVSEDWGFSHQLWRAGGKAVATSKVKVRHVGRYLFDSAECWGVKVDPPTQGEPLPAFAEEHAAYHESVRRSREESTSEARGDNQTDQLASAVEALVGHR